MQSSVNTDDPCTLIQQGGKLAHIFGPLSKPGKSLTL